MPAEDPLILTQMRQCVEDVIHLTPYNSDQDLQHWLTARGNNVSEASDMFRKSMYWRRDFHVNELVKWQPPALLMQYFPQGSSGVDRQGHRVYLYNIGMLDMRGLMRCVQRTDLLKFGIWQMERFKWESCEQHMRLGRFLGRCGIVVDLQHLQLHQITNRAEVGVLLEWIQLFEANYPDTLAWCLAINVPRIFSIVWRLISPLLNHVTRSKISLLAADSWVPQLSQLVAADQLPAYWGGLMVGHDDDVLCSNLVCHGGIVPSSLLTTNQQLHDLKSLLPLFCTVTAGHTSTYTLHVTSPGCRVKYEFVSTGGELYYRVYCQTAASEDQIEQEQSVFPRRLVFSHLHPEHGQFTAKFAGEYIIEFDNRSSYLRSRQVHFCFDIM